jgi:RNA recognition motif-containing protein
MNIYVGNMSYNVTDSDLRAEFEPFGQVTTVNIITDRETGQPKGFAFVEMAEETAAKAAIGALNGKDIKGRNVTVNEARPRKERSPSGGQRERRW